ncbi:MAG TPA: molecular chaperone HtpG [Chthoniobacterales bacterium]|jgi:molecular chaperone HtpG
MSTTATPERHEFQAEISQLLDIVIHSLYTDKEIFVRELISNGADALEKLKFLQTSGKPVFQPELETKISITTDDTAHTIAFTDTGIGMTHDELIENLGTIAHSGSKAFLKQLAENKGDTSLIGQFGVGFYAAFMVADKVSVYSRSYQEDAQGWCWTSDGKGGYDLEPADDLPRGTKILVHLKEDEKQFATKYTIESVIKRYSNFVSAPIELNGEKVNTVKAIWSRSKSEITDEEYKEFFQFIAHESTDPLYRLHFNADAPISIQSLLFVPERNMEKITMTRAESDVSLYSKRVLITPKAKGLFPEWLRFLKGVVDSEDLPLNISRETMQDSALMQKLNKVITGRFLKFLSEEATNDPEKYAKFFAEFGNCIKEGAVNDYAHREQLSKLLRFESSFTEKGKVTSLSDYISRMPEGQKEIYYVLAPNRENAETSPYYEGLKAKNYECLFLADPWDEFVMDHLRKFEDKDLKPAEKAQIEVESTGEGLSEDAAKSLATFFQETLGAERVNEVRVSKRLADSPAVALESDKMLTSSMRRMMKQMGNGMEMPDGKPDFEVNPRHPVMVRLESMRAKDSDLAGKVAEQIFDSSLAAAGMLEDPRTMLKRMNDLMEKLLEEK